MLLWLFDTSSAEAERSKLAQRLEQAEAALDALTRLIEAAPFPMWYRGPDLSLGLVNSAFVEAVEGRDAADVIARSSELIGDVNEAQSSAMAALESGKPTSRKQAAIVRGVSSAALTGLVHIRAVAANASVAGFPNTHRSAAT